LVLAWLVESLNLGRPGLVDKVEMAVGSAIGCLDLITSNELLQFGCIFLLEENGVCVVLHPLYSVSLHIIYKRMICQQGDPAQQYIIYIDLGEAYE
jgi:hypothetical protein